MCVSSPININEKGALMNKTDVQTKMSKFHNFLSQLTWLPSAVARLSIGWVFLTSGWGKLHNLEQIVGYFQSLGVPLAHIQAPVVSVLELVGGLALIIGAGTRYFSAILMGIMSVAIMTAHAEDINQLSDMFKIYEFVYIIALGYLATLGAGKFSADYIIKMKFK